MVSRTLLTVLSLFALLSFSAASIPSFGTQTQGGIRDKLRDRAFRIRPDKGTVVEAPTFRVAIADLANFPALAGQDVQSTVVRVTLEPGQPLFRHYHPRGTETLNAIEGTFRCSFIFEGLGDVRNVTNTIRAGESTVFPQGLIHETTCLSKLPCKFVSVLNSADPGTIPAPKV